MSRKYLAFDIETAKILPENFGDLHDHRPLGITCMATWCTDESVAVTFYSKNADGTPAPQMTKADVTAFVEHLKTKLQEGYTLITHNGLGFDFVIVAEECGKVDYCRGLDGHVDMMFTSFAGKGFPLSSMRRRRP